MIFGKKYSVDAIHRAVAFVRATVIPAVLPIYYFIYRRLFVILATISVSKHSIPVHQLSMREDSEYQQVNNTARAKRRNYTASLLYLFKQTTNFWLC